MNKIAGYASILLMAAALAPAQSNPPSAAEALAGSFADINRKVLAMAKDFPEGKYSFKLKPEMRSFGEVIVHIASGNDNPAKAGRGEKLKGDELAAKNYPTTAQIVSLREKAIADSTATLKQYPEGWQKSLEPFLSVTEHSAEHYGLLVAYYRANGMVPPIAAKK